MTETTTGPTSPSTTGVAGAVGIAVLLTANFTLAVDFSILNVALPEIGRDVGLPTSALQWIVTSFALCAAGLTLLFGRVADLAGRKRLFLIGIALLGASSLLGGLATSSAMLLSARVGQGVATAMVAPAALALMTTMFAEGPARSRALGLNGALMAAGFTVGALLGGVLTGTVSWRWAFLLNVIVAAAVLATGPAVLREPASGPRPRLDLPGAITVTLALVALVLGIDTAGRDGWAAPGAWAPILVAVLLATVFLAIESRSAEPLIEPALLRRPGVAWGNLAGLLAFATETSLVFVLTLFLQEVLGYGAVVTGLVFAVIGAGTVFGGLVAPRIIGLIGARAAIVAGLLVQAAATLPLAFLPADPGGIPLLLATTFLGGAANLIAIVGYTVAATAGIPAGQQGLATGLVTMSQQVGIALGTPVMAAVVTALLPDGMLSGLRAAVAVNAGLAVAAGALVAVFLRSARGRDR